MCGIVGIFSYGKTGSKAFEKMRTEAGIFMMTELLALTKPRGEDATGISTLFEDGSFSGLKMAVASDEFISRYGNDETYFDGYLNLLRNSEVLPKITIGHCRKASMGSSSNANNVHPIKVRNMVGIHNGTLKNADTIFKNLGCGRDGTVDSEAIIRLLQHYTDEGRQPFTVNNLNEVAQRLNGPYSVLAFNGNNPNQVAGLRDTRPMDIAAIAPLQMVIVASEKKFIEAALHKYNMFVNNYGNPHKMPHLLPKDVKFRYLPDETLIVFNLKKTIEEGGDIDKLYITEKIPKQGKLWQTATAPIAGAAATNRAWEDNQATANKGTTGSAVGAQNRRVAQTLKDQVKDTEGDATGKAGKSWDKQFGRYDNVNDNEVTDAAGLPALEVEAEKITKLVSGATTGDSLGVEVDPKRNIDLTETKANLNSSHPVGQADAIIIELTNEVDGNGDSIADKDGNAIDPNATQRIEVDMTVDIELMKEVQAASDELERYSTSSDVAKDLEVTDITVISSLPIATLCNRVGIKAFKRGYLAAKEADNDVDGNTLPVPVKSEAVTSKMKAGEKHIRFLKSMAGIMAKVMTSVHLKDKDQLGKLVAASLREASERNSEIDTVLFDSVFTAGDIRNSVGIRTLRTVLEAKEANEKDN